MRKLIYCSIFPLLAGCGSQHQRGQDFIERILDLTTTTVSTKYEPGEYVQFTNLYDTLVHSIPEDKDEKLILVERLKKRGFKITNSGRGNFPPLGPRIVMVELTDGSCVCEVSKIYYSTTTDTLYQMAEGINCKRND
jgi:hypothetical protein